MKKYIVAAVLSTVSFSFAFAQTVTDTLDAGSTSSCVVVTYNMSLGSKDAKTNGQVSDLQGFLQDQGYLSAEPTGYFGAQTKRAVQSFQSANRITPNGVVGPYTRKKVKDVSCGTSDTTVATPSNTNSAGVSSSDVPVITTVSKSTAAVGKTVAFYGSNLGSDTYISWGGVNGFTFFPTKTTGSSLEFTIPDVNPGTYDVSVNRKADTPVYTRQNTTRITVATRDLDPSTFSDTSTSGLSAESSDVAGRVKVKLAQSRESNSAGEPFTVTWSSENATFCMYETSSTNINGGAWQTEARDLSGSRTYSYALAAVHQSRVTCYGSSGAAPVVATITHKITYDRPALPSCSITTDKDSYAYGDTIKISYTSTNATYATWVPDTSGRDNFVLGVDKLDASGQTQIIANRAPNPFVTLKVFNAFGQSATCQKVIPVSIPSSTTPSTTAVPYISRAEFISSDGQAGNVNILGGNFSSTANTVDISGKTAVVPAVNGTIITVPFSSSVARTFLVKVSTSAGTSNIVSFTTSGAIGTSNTSQTGTGTVTTPPAQVPSATLGLSFYTSIGKNDTFYMSWSGTNSPTSYSLKIDDTLIPQGTATTWNGTPASLGLAAGNHTFSVKACNSAGCGMSQIVTRTVTEPVITAPAPTTTTVTPPTSTTPVSTPATPTFYASCVRLSGGTYGIVMAWSPVSGAINYPVRIQDPSGKETDIGMGAVGDAAPTGTSYTFGGLTTPGQYMYWGHAWNTSGWSSANSGYVACTAPTSSAPAENTLAANSSTGAVLGASAQCVDLPVNMHRGYASYSVTRLQTFLKSIGLTDEVSGFYGDKTVTAVKEYQASKGLPQTGMVYDFTRQLIKQDSCQ